MILQLLIFQLLGIIANAAEVPLVLRYTEPAVDWESEATPIGNGFIGGMIYGGVHRDKIQINEHTLWTGGPGQEARYNGGHKGTRERAQTGLRTVRQFLQQKMQAFTESHSARLENGNLIIENYPADEQIVKDNLDPLMGEKDLFGSYQSFGTIRINKYTPGQTETPKFESVTGNCQPPNLSEGLESLFDGNQDTKWYSASAAAGGWSQPLPYNMTWSYTAAMRINQYSFVSANDVQERDPVRWDLYGSVDGRGFELIDSRSGVTFNNRHQRLTFTLNREVSFRYFQLIIHELRGGNSYYCQLADIELGAEEPEEPEAFSNYVKTVDLDNSVVNVKYTQEGVDYTREYFASYPDNVIGIRLTASRAASLTRSISFASDQRNVATETTVTGPSGYISVSGLGNGQSASGLKIAAGLRVLIEGGSISNNADELIVQNANTITIYFSTKTNYQLCKDESFNFFSNEDPRATVAFVTSTAAAAGYDVTRQRHVGDYLNLANRTKISFGSVTSVPTKTTRQLLQGYSGKSSPANTEAEDRYLEMVYYQFGRYLLISSSRPNTLPANLQGIWAAGLSPPWASDYHTNVNLQMNYWPAETTNLPECAVPFVEYIDHLVPRGRITANYYYCKQTGEPVRGWCVHHENNIWGNTAPGNYYFGFYFPAAGAWLCKHIYEHYLFTQDREFLQSHYNTMLEAALFWVDNLWEDARDGTLVANPSYSPEHGGYSLGAHCDQAIINDLFKDTIAASEALEIGSSREIEEIRRALSRLSPPSIGLGGQFQEWKDEVLMDYTGDGQHRHVNHLFYLHPGSEIVDGRSSTDNAYTAAMRKTLITRGDGGTGWSKAWKINFWARLHDGNHAQTLLSELLKDSTLTNMFDTHPPFQIDGNFGGTAGMTEMLLQSQGAYIDLLPALSDKWGVNGVGRGIRARGGFEVDLAWNNKVLTTATIRSLSGKRCSLKYNNIGNYEVVSDGVAVPVTTVDNLNIYFDTVAGRTYTLRVR